MNTVMTRLTPPGTAAIATVGIFGPRAWIIACTLFERLQGTLPEQPAAGRFWYGHAGGRQGDEVVLAVRSTHPHPWIDIHCHGGVVVTRWLMDQLITLGAEEVAWPDFLAQAQTDAGKDLQVLPWLAIARTERTAGILLDQYHGAYRRAIAAAQLAFLQGDVAEATRILRDLARWIPLGQHLTEPWKIAVVGPPNAGKSSLINALAGYQRSIVAPIPGTTRDVVRVELAFDSWLVELADTAGLRDAPDDLEREGVQRARDTLAHVDLCLWVMDGSAAFPGSVADFARDTGIDPHRVIPVINKHDLPAAWDTARIPGAASISATNRTGMDALIRRMVLQLVPETPDRGVAVPYAPACVCEVQDALAALAAGSTPLGW